MKLFVHLTLLAALASPAIPYFKYQRLVQGNGAGERYLTVDEAVWQHARPDLGDLRLYAGDKETPYALIIERGSRQHDHKDVPVLQQSLVGGKTQFLIDMSALAQYDHVDLKLSTRNFVAHARVEGQDDLHAPRWAVLGDSILYDLSKENLGSNSMLRLPRSTYKYLRVTVDGPVKPDEVYGASSELHEQRLPVWRDVAGEPQTEQKGRDTVLTFTVPENVPVERAVFDVDAAQPNFRRQVEIQNDKEQVMGLDEISRVHMVRAGRRIDAEDTDADFSEIGQKTLKIIIRNGDDPPLKLKSARLQQLERRIYFAAPQSALTLYYGDEKLERPVYDYAKFFQQEKGTAAVQLGAEVANPAYTGRPDDRPWTERYPAVLWIAIIAAVLVLGAVALRALRSAAA